MRKKRPRGCSTAAPTSPTDLSSRQLLECPRELGGFPLSLDANSLLAAASLQILAHLRQVPRSRDNPRGRVAKSSHVAANALLRDCVQGSQPTRATGSMIQCTPLFVHRASRVHYLLEGSFCVAPSPLQYLCSHRAQQGRQMPVRTSFNALGAHNQRQVRVSRIVVSMQREDNRMSF